MYWQTQKIYVLIVVLLLSLSAGAVLQYWYWQTGIRYTANISAFLHVEEEGGSESRNALGSLVGPSVLFVGDIMLDRGVEYQMKRYGLFYPFRKISQFLKGADIVFGNLECPIVEDPPHFPDSSLKFAVPAQALEGLIFANFNLLGLANNHTLNMGHAGLAQTRGFLQGQGIDFAGDPISCTESFAFAKENIRLLAFNKTFSFNCSNQDIAKAVNAVRLKNPEAFLIVALHWGEEYQPTGSFFQQELAHLVIDAGADLIIGHHPHVVQNIEEYKGKLIFYSLGNFIFDQYFSKATQQALAVKLELYSGKAIYRLFPIDSELSQPFLMPQVEAKEFLEALASKSSPQLLEQIKKGIVEIEIK